VEQGVAGAEQVHEPGRLADPLDDEGDRAALGVAVGDGQGDAFAARVDADDDELAGLALAGDPRRLDDEALDLGGQELGRDYRKHPVASPASLRPRRPSPLMSSPRRGTLPPACSFRTEAPGPAPAPRNGPSRADDGAALCAVAGAPVRF